MRTLQWVIFIPVALVLGILAGFLGNFLMSEFFSFGERISWATSGVFSGSAIIFSGLLISPSKTKSVKVILIVLTILLGILSLVGDIYSNKITHIWSGIGMIFIAILTIRVPVDEMEL